MEVKVESIRLIYEMLASFANCSIEERIRTLEVKVEQGLSQSP